MFSAIQRGDVEAIGALLAADAVYVGPASVAPASGEVSGLEFVRACQGLGQYFDTKTLAWSHDYFVVDGDAGLVAVWTTMSADTVTGRPYRNQYAWLFRFSGLEISEIRELTDTASAFAQLET